MSVMQQMMMARSGSGSGVPWNPDLLPNNPSLWYNDVGIVQEDVAGIATSWANVGHYGTPASTIMNQGTGANRPQVRVAGLNGMRTIDFDGSNDSMREAESQIFSSVAAGYLFAVVRKNVLSGATTTNQMLFWVSTGTSNVARFVVYMNQATNIDKYSVGARRLDGDSSSFLGGPAIPDTGFHMFLVTMDWSAGDVTMYLDGTQTQQNLSFTTSGTTSAAASANAPAMCSSGIGVEVANAEVAEFIVGRALPLPTATEIDKMFGWAAHKWGLTALLPGGHPYKTVAPTV